MTHDILKLVRVGLYREALALYSQQHSSSLRPHRFTFPPLLKACAELQNPPLGQLLHTHLVKTGFLADYYSATALTGMYMKLCLLDDGLKVFDEMPERNSASMNAAVSGLTQNGYFREAFCVVRSGLYGDFRPNSVTIASLLPACEKSVCLAGTMHCWAIKLGVEEDVYVATSILTVYFKCKEMVLAKKVFKKMPNKNLVSYNAYVSGLLESGKRLEVLGLFKKMMERLEEKPNYVTLVSVLSACAGLLYVVFGRQVHGLAIKNDLAFNVMVGTALVDMYCKCGVWQLAYDVFKELSEHRNLVTWNAIISGMMLNSQCENAVVLFEELETVGLEPDLAIWNSMIIGFAQLGKGIEAFKYFKRMQSAGVASNLKSMTSMLAACADLSVLRSGKEIHGHSTRILVNKDKFMATALMDFYMKCGFSTWARRVFDCFDVKPDDPAFWNAMISGYGRNGDYESAFRIFDQMLEEKVQPSAATFVSVLSVCGHTGQVDEGWKIFRMMTREFSLKPKPVHFSCMVDLLARSGRLDEARELIQKLPEPSASVFASMLGACLSNLDSELGEVMAKRLLELKPESSIPYVVLANIYAGLGRWKDVERIRGMMNAKGNRKFAGFSLLEVN